MFALLWLLAVLQLGYVRFVENRPLDSIGLQPVSPLVFAFGVVVGFLLLAVLSAIPEVLLQQFGRALPDESGLFLLAQPPHWKVAVALSAGVPEAILFYGYLIERVIELTGNPLWAVGLSTLLAARARASLAGRRFAWNGCRWPSVAHWHPHYSISGSGASSSSQGPRR
ncbi:hypothetical protein BRD15_09055 [Halobacteriales archaeon SW_6_65_15]|nr:MAG: hypothetical protein BRD15_09055 [Halobacteriales archaeon SW_6_65_15]